MTRSALPTSLRGIGRGPMVKAFLDRPIEGDWPLDIGASEAEAF